jgi:hypothetical protein
VGPGGVALSSDALSAVDEYFNGNVTKKIKGKIVANTTVVSTNFTPQVVNLTVDAPGGNKAAIETAISKFLQPEARDPKDESTFLWQVGEDIHVSRLAALIAAASPDVDFTLGGTGSGSISGVVGTQTVTGTGTSFLTQLNPGDRIFFRTVKLTVMSIVSNTQLVTVEIIENSFANETYKFETEIIRIPDGSLPVKGTIIVKT